MLFFFFFSFLNYMGLRYSRTSLIAQLVKNLPAMQETRVRFLDQEDPLEKEMATHSSILAWRISWPEEPPGLQSMGSQRTGPDWACTHANHSVKNRLLSIPFDQNFLHPWLLHAFVNSCPHIAIFYGYYDNLIDGKFSLWWVKWW